MSEYLRELEELVRHESPSDDKSALDAFAELLAGKLDLIHGARVEVISAASAGNHVRAEWGGGAAEGPVLLLGHYDTVWLIGTLERMPFRVDGDLAHGPGVLDMKAGPVMALAAIRAHREGGGERPIVLLVTSDEEVGSESSRSLIEDEARRCAFALVLEPALDDGRLKTSRRGLARYRLEVTGKASHSGLAPCAGVNAIDELRDLLQVVSGLADPELETEINVGVIEGGSRFNVVAAHAACEIGVRVRMCDEDVASPPRSPSCDPAVRALRWKSEEAHSGPRWS